MRIAYLCYLSTTADSGVTAKIRSQLAIWRRLGHDAVLYCATREAPSGTSLEEAERGRGAVIQGFGSPPRRVAAMLALERAILRAAPDLVYVRYDLFTPPPVRLLGRVPTVVECNTDDVEEMRLRSGLSQRYNRINRRLVYGGAAGIVFVSNELAASQRFTRYAKPSLVLGNGIDLASVEQLAPTGNTEPRFAFLGEPSPWQGIDQVLALAAALPRSRFDLVGPGRLDSAPPNVTAHGVLGAREYRDILASCDVGLGTLALYRKGMREASPLKVREYLAHGLPTLIGYDDTDFVDGAPWFLERVPNQAWAVDEHAGRIARFAKAAIGRRVARSEIAHLDAHEKERRRLDFLESIAARGSA